MATHPESLQSKIRRQTTPMLLQTKNITYHEIKQSQWERDLLGSVDKIGRNSSPESNRIKYELRTTSITIHLII